VGATFLVAVLPTAFIWWLRSEGMIRSPLLTLVIALVATLAASRVGTAYWEKRTSPGDLLFGELLLWGFIRRCNSERRLSSARSVLGSLADTHGGVAGDQSSGIQAQELEKLSAALEATDPYTHGHSRRVARHCWMIAKRMGLDSDTVDHVRTAAALHDVGKVYTPASVLRKPGRLTDEEFDVIKRHPVDGAELVKALGDEQLVSIVRHHHERLDGTGYPDRLQGEQIPIGARIISVADTFDAITSARPYRPARAHKKALDILKYEAGTQLDPAVVKAFCAIYSGRRPLALWASFTSLPSQFFSWLGAGAASAASAAQVAAVAAAAAVGATAAVQTHRAPHRSHRPSGHVQLADVATPVSRGTSSGNASPARAAVHLGSHHSISGSAKARSTTGPTGTGTTSAAGSTAPAAAGSAPSGSQAGNGETASTGNGGSDQLSHEGTQTPGAGSGEGFQSSSEAKGTPVVTEVPKPTSPKEGKGSTEGKRTIEEKREAKEAREAREAKARAEKEAKEAKAKEEKEAREAKAKMEKEAKEAKEAKAKAEKEAKEAKAKEEKEAREAKAKMEKEAKEAKAREEKKAKEGKGVVTEVLETVAGTV
jgi:putative nucleotidyltransferase with HDIG domain